MLEDYLYENRTKETVQFVDTRDLMLLFNFRYKVSISPNVDQGKMKKKPKSSRCGNENYIPHTTNHAY